MPWRRLRDRGSGAAARDPFVLAVTQPVTATTAPRLVERISRIAASSPVVVDLTAIPSFDSVGTAALADLQDSMEAGRVTLVGLRQATARLLGSDDAPSLVRTPTDGSRWVLRRLRAIAVVQTTADEPVPLDGVEPLLRSALDEEVGIVVLDLRNATLEPADLHLVTNASSEAAVRGQELLVVNVDPETAERLRESGLSSTTYVAPEPFDLP
jgi:anti-anti-sigma regulatory factor